MMKSGGGGGSRELISSAVENTGSAVSTQWLKGTHEVMKAHIENGRRLTVATLQGSLPGNVC